jgi:HD-like signal output (HDOD) protein
LSPRDIPTLPATMIELLQIANDPGVSVARLDRAISRDQALTLRVLAVANSSFYGCSRRIDSVRTAIALLGTEQIQNVASVMALAPAFESAFGPDLWAHGLATALWTRHVGAALRIPAIGYLFTTALMHDIGIVLFLRNAPQEETRCLAEATDSEASLVDLERAAFGIDHAVLGARASVVWQLPERIAELVATHHHPPGSEVDHLVLTLADALTAHTGTPAVPGGTEPWPPPALEALDLTSTDLEGLLDRADTVRNEAAVFG